MITDPLEEWRSLKDHYGRLSEEELKSLLEESSQLTDIAKETLRAEISSRSLRVQVRDTPPSDAFLNDFGIPCYFGRDNLESVDALPPDSETAWI
jgi:hypothetical protein